MRQMRLHTFKTVLIAFVLPCLGVAIGLGCGGSEETKIPTPDVGAEVKTAVAEALPTATPSHTPDINATIEAGMAATMAAIPPTPTLGSCPTPPSVPTSARQDVTPPELVSISLAPSEVDVSHKDGEITVTARVVDDLSGVSGVLLCFVSPTAGQEWVVFPGAVLFGLITDGEFVRKLTLPRYSEAGMWRLELARVIDNVGNGRVYERDELAQLGLSASIRVIAAEEDLTPPELVDLFFDPTEVEVNGEYALVDVSVFARDNMTGVRSVKLYLANPKAGYEQNEPVEWTLKKSDAAWRFERTLGAFHRFNRGGTWRIARIEIEDTVGNRREYTFGELNQMGFSPSFKLTGTTEDVTRPELISLVLEPYSVDVSRGYGEITFRAQAADDLSGVVRMEVVFVSPTVGQTVTAHADDYYSPKGELGEKEFEGTAWLPPFSEIGIWSLKEVNVRDWAGNVNSYGIDNLNQLGLPTSFEVTAPEVDLPAIEGDVEPPEVMSIALGRFHGFPINPESARVIHVTIHVADHASGVKSVHIDFVHPTTGREERILARGPVYGSITEGSYHAGLIARKPIVGIPQLEGNVVRVEVADNAGNIRTYGLAELPPLTTWVID